MSLGKTLKFQQYYQQYFSKIYNYVYFRLSQNQSLAEDLTQDIFIQALEHFESFDEKVPFGVWIYKIAKNKIIDTYRRKKIQQQSLDSVENSVIASTHANDEFVQDIDLDIDLQEVRAAIEKLPEKFQEIITLKYINDLANEEICEILHCDGNFIRVNLHRAHQKLIEILKHVSK